MSEAEISAEAVEFAKRNKNRIAKELTDNNIYTPAIRPISVFMAGSPGAGKTEFSKNLITILDDKDNKNRVVRIDGDEIRPYFHGYTGSNSFLFQSAVAIIVEKMHDCVLERKQNFILDGTLSKYDKADQNIRRSLQRQRPVFVFYVYQRPEIAWLFTQSREKIEGRSIPKTAFIEQFLGAKKVVERIMAEFANKVTLFLVKKDFTQKTAEIKKLELKNGGLDYHIPDGYTKEELEKLL